MSDPEISTKSYSVYVGTEGYKTYCIVIGVSATQAVELFWRRSIATQHRSLEARKLIKKCVLDMGDE